MNKLNKESKAATADFISALVNDLQSRISVNDATIENRKIASNSSLALAADISKVVKIIQDSLSNESIDPNDRISKSLEMVSALQSSLESFPRTEREEIIRLEASQDGMRRVIDVIREAANTYAAEASQPEPKFSPQSLQDVDWDDT